MTYEEFLRTKGHKVQDAGFVSEEVNPKLFDWQTDVVHWALRKGRAAIFSNCGSGKTAMFLQWAKEVNAHTGKPILVLTPLAVAQQTKREGDKFGIPVNVCRTQEDVNDGINVVNYEMMQHFADGEFWGGVVLDECFTPDTEVETITESGIVHKPIADVKPGDKVRNCIGEDTVVAVKKKKVPYAIRVGFNGGTVICSPRHPFLTKRGWVCAKELKETDVLASVGEAMRILRGDFSNPYLSGEEKALLQSVLFSEVENEPAANKGEDSHTGNSREDRSEGFCVDADNAGGAEKRRADSQAHPDGEPGNEGESICQIAGNAPRTFKAWGQWQGDDIAAAVDDGCFARRMGCGTIYLTGPETARLPDSLQGRLRELSDETCNRTGWELALFQKRARQEEGRKTGFYGLDSFEVLEQGCCELDQYRDAEGSLYFYDIEVQRHPSFTINGCLVHNSSILKHKDSKTRNALQEKFRETPFKLCCTATPSPNDFMELGTHSEFLGVMKQTEMLSMFFVHDGGETQKWRLKGHAEKRFFEWVAGWAACFRDPKDIGYSGEGYWLPELRVHDVVVKSDTRELENGQQMFFAPEGKTLLERRSARRNSLKDRVAKAAEIANATDEQVLVWCDLNSESKALAKAISGAVEVEGSMPLEQKEEGVVGFLTGKYRVLVSKPSIAGFGINAQNACKEIFVGLSDSFEQYYQAVRRCWRFGQTRDVDVYIITSDAEGEVKKNIERKQRDAERMTEELVGYTREYLQSDLRRTTRDLDRYHAEKEMEVPGWLTA